MKTKLKKKISKKKKVTRSKVKPKVIVIRTSREERPRMRDSVASGFGAGFGVAAGHEVGDWLLNPGRKGRRRNPIGERPLDFSNYETNKIPPLYSISEKESRRLDKLATEDLSPHDLKVMRKYLEVDAITQTLIGKRHKVGFFLDKKNISDKEVVRKIHKMFGSIDSWLEFYVNSHDQLVKELDSELKEHDLL